MTMILFDPDQPEAAGGFVEHDALPGRRTLLKHLRAAQEAVGLRGEVSVLLTTDEGIRGLNRRFRRKNKATDVLSFPAEPGFGVAGDLAISVDTAARQAEEQGHGLGVELRVLMLHGLLHLAGMDHEADDGEMARREARLRGRLRLPLGLIERVTAGVETRARLLRGNAGAEAPAYRSGKATAKAKAKKQIPFGNDNKKSKGNDNSKRKDNDNSKGNDNSKRKDNDNSKANDKRKSEGNREGIAESRIVKVGL